MKFLSKMSSCLSSSRPFSLWLYLLMLALLSGLITPLSAQQRYPFQHQELTQNEILDQYFLQETEKIEQQTATALADTSDWPAKQAERRKLLGEMLGLEPLPERTPLKVQVTKEIEKEDYLIRNLHYQALPGLYVTANLYLPKEVKKPGPAILYVCGHSSNKKNGISYGNKFGYHQHGIWFAQNGYTCLIIDTVQLGEFQGLHHGTYRHGMWWWNARGYTPAGVETWAGIRGIDYLQSLAEVDPERIGVTGRSGGGGYSWYIAAMDERIKAAVPVAGITTMRNHIVDDCIEGHCDCMFMLNTYRWDFALVTSLIAPRPVLLTNTDKDRIFPLDGVVQVYWQTRKVYEALGAGDHFGLAIAEGPHRDTQRLQVNAFEWFNRFLKEENPQAEPAEKIFQPEDLRVFQELPQDEITSKIHESFVPTAQIDVPKSQQEWSQLQESLTQKLKEQCFRGWPARGAPLEVERLTTDKERDHLVDRLEYISQKSVRLPMIRIRSLSNEFKPGKQFVVFGGKQEWNTFEAGEWGDWGQNAAESTLLIFPRGIGPTAWEGSERDLTHIRRRFALLGQTQDGMRLWDLIRALDSLRGPIQLEASGEMAGIALYAPLFTDNVESLVLHDLPASHQDGPIFLNVLKVLDIPQTLALVAEKCPIQLTGTNPQITEFAEKISELPDSKAHPITFVKSETESEK